MSSCHILLCMLDEWTTKLDPPALPNGINVWRDIAADVALVRCNNLKSLRHCLKSTAARLGHALECISRKAVRRARRQLWGSAVFAGDPTCQGEHCCFVMRFGVLGLLECYSTWSTLLLRAARGLIQSAQRMLTAERLL